MILARNFKLYVFLAVLISVQFFVASFHHNTKRALLFSDIFVLQLTCCITVPSSIPSRTFFLNMCVQGNYMAISNTSQFTPITIPANARAITGYDFNKQELYGFMQNWMDGHSLNGNECLLRTICEAADIPFDRSYHNNFLENILHYIFTPSENVASDNEIILKDKYYEAEILGKNGTNCEILYPDCGLPVLDFISKVFY